MITVVEERDVYGSTWWVLDGRGALLAHVASLRTAVRIAAAWRAAEQGG